MKKIISKKRSSRMTAKDDKIVKQSVNFVKALKRVDLPGYMEVATNPWKVFFFSFLRGTGFGLGTLLGASIIFTVLAYIYRLLEKMPFFGEIFRDIARFFGW